MKFSTCLFRACLLVAGLFAASIVRAQAPTITAISAPRQVVTKGQNLTLSMTATGATSYQWKRSGKAIAGATSADYAITGAQPVRDNGWYQAVATNGSGSTTSAVVFLSVAVNSGQVIAFGQNSSGQTNVPAGLTDIAAIASGSNSYHALALRSTGLVVGWGGGNTYGETTVPAGLTNVVAISTGNFHSLALKSDGTVVAWGYNGYGQATVPVGLTSVVALAGGSSHSLALKSDGTVVAWGYNGYGQTTVPAGLTGVVAIAAGDNYSLALKSDGTVVAWGYNGNGQTTVPAGLTGVVAIAAGTSHVLALKSDGTVIAWGYNGYNQTAVPAGLTNVVAIAGGAIHSLALKSDSSIVGWGYNGDGQTTAPAGLSACLGITAGSTFSVGVRDGTGDLVPTITTQPVGQTVNLGQAVIFAVAASGGAATPSFQWRKNGTNISGATSSSYTITEVVAGSAGSYDVVVSNYLGSATSNAAALAVNSAPIVSATNFGRYGVAPGQSLTLTLSASIGGAATVQWKRNGFPISGATARTYTISNATPLASGYYQAVYNEGSGSVTSAPIFVQIVPVSTQVIGWGDNQAGYLTGLTNVISFRASQSGYQTIALRSDGTVLTSSYTSPSGLGNVVGVEASSYHYLALKADGTVVAWGSNEYGQINVPAGLTNVIAIAVGEYHSLALKADGTVVAWGDSSLGATAVPAGLSGVVAIAAGGWFNLALKADGTVVGWGNNSSGQSTPPASLANVVAISAGRFHSLALRSDGTVAGWGYNGSGEIDVPSNLAGVTAISAGNASSLALKSDGTVTAWGYQQAPVPNGLNSVFRIAAGYFFAAAVRDSSGDVAPTIATQPVGVSAYTGQDVTLSVGASGGTALISYQWRKGGTSISGATGASLKLPRVTTNDIGNYDVVISNQFGSITSQVAALTVSATPAVGTNLTGRQVVNAGQGVTLTAIAAIAPPLTYQWKRNGRVLPGETNASLSLSNLGWRDTGAYQVIATNASGPALSDPVWIMVTKPTQVVAYGLNSDTQINVPAGLTDAVSVAAGELHSMAVKSDGTIVVWGDSGYGQRPAPSGLTNVVQVAAGRYHSMALRSDGTVLTWGELNYAPSGLKDVIAIAGAGGYGMALKFDGSVVSWNSGGLAIDVPVGLSAVAIAGSASFRIALKADGSVVVWYGPSAPVGLTNVTAISAGSDHALALKSDGTVVAWGGDGWGQASVPAGLSNVVAIVAGHYMSYALKNDGTVVAWGDYDVSTAESARRSAPALGLAATSHTLVLRDPAADTVPAISTHPTGGALSYGSSKTLSVSATGGILSYQWRVNGSTLSGATNSTCMIEYFTVPASYDVVVSNHLGSVTSNVAALTLTSAPTITSQPVSVAVNQGQPASFSVVVNANPAPTYQWQKNSVNISGATSSTLTLGNVQSGDAGNYRVVVTNSVSSATSNTATLSVNTPPVITTQPPAGTTVGAVGANVTFSIVATGTAPLSYQWRKDGVNISGATSASLNLFNAQLSATGSYDVVVTNVAGSVTSNSSALVITQAPVFTSANNTTFTAGTAGTFTVTATGVPVPTFSVTAGSFPSWATLNGTTGVISGTPPNGTGSPFSFTLQASTGYSSTTQSFTLTVNTLPIISTQPINTSVNLGASASLSVFATGIPLPTFQWRKGGVAIGGATNTTLSFSSAQQSDAGNYDVVVTNVVGSVTSNTATLTVVTLPPTITTQPVGGTVGVGGGFTFSVVAGGSPTLSYQWRRNGISLPWATSASFGIPNAQTWDNGDYDVVVTNPFGTVTSSAARLTVVLRPVAISARVVIGSGEPAIATFTVEGSASKTLLLRVVGPGITPFGFTNVVPDPQLDVFDSAASLIASNNDWSTASNAAAIASTTSAVGAFGLATGSRDSVVLQGFAPGNYTVRATGNGGVGGVAYLELYDADLPATTSRIPFVAVRARVAPGDAIMVGGLASSGRGVRSYLIRAAGPALGLAGAFANPSLVVAREASLVGSNDDWDAAGADGAAVATATSRVTAFPFAAGSRDSAVVLTGNLHAGAHTVQVGGASGAGTVLLELHDLDATRPLAFAPVVVSPPVPQAVAAGAAISLASRAHGTAPLSYQWRKDGVNIPNATAQTYSVAAAQPADGGIYSVAVTNALGTAASLAAQVTVGGVQGAISATHGVLGGGYNPGGTVTISSTLSFTGTATSLGWNVTLPAGWAFVSDAGVTAQVKPVSGTTGTLGWAWSDSATSPQTFTYTLAVPATESVPRNITATAIVRTGVDPASTVLANPSPLTVEPRSSVHSADTNQDNAISLIELTRVIELYNTRNGTVRTGCYQVDANGEDGFAPHTTRAAGSVAALVRYHSADTRGAGGSARDGAIDLIELTRVIELYNVRNGTTRTGQYHVQAGTEDGFAPGP